MRYVKHIDEKVNFILGMPNGDPNEEFGKPFFIELKKPKKLKKYLSLNPRLLKATWTKGEFGDVVKIEGGTNNTLQNVLDTLDNKKDGIQSMGWIDLEESIEEEESEVNEKKVPVNRETIEYHIDSYKVSDDPYDVAKEIGNYYNWTPKEIEKAEKLIRKYYIKESQREVKKSQKLIRKYHIKESEKPVTKIMWDRKMTDDQKETALLSVFKDPDDVDKWIDAKYDDLPPQTSHMYTEKLKEYPLAKKPFHGSGKLGKEIEEASGKQWDSPEQAKLAAATANFKNAIIAVDADEMLRTYKDIEKHLKAYFRNERWRY